MTEQERERLSALVDGELARAQAVRAVDAALDNEAQRERWERYHLIGAALRAEAHAASGELAHRVREALDSEPVALTPRREPARTARLAIAASLVVAVVAGAWMLSGDPGEPAVEVAAGGAAPAAVPPEAPAATSLAEASGTAELAARISEARGVDPVEAAGGLRTLAGATVAGAGSRWPAAQGATPRRLSDYLVSHNERGGMTGMHPYARIVAYPDAFR